jgi:hypothetical protein
MANGLIDLQTDLTSLRYSTMPLGSKSPYIVKSIDNPPSSNQVSMEITKRIDDTSRIAQMLIDKPGIKYLLHEAELQQINADQKIRKAQQGGKTLVGAVLQQIGKTIVSTLKIAGSTLAQIPVNGTGTHFLKGFRTDTYLQPTNGNNFSAFASFFGAGGVEGAQYALRGEEVSGEHKSELEGRDSKYNYDEYLNTPIPKDSSGHRALAEAGKPITIPGPQYETTAQPFELGRSNKLKEADQGELLGNNGRNVGKAYSSQDTYTGKEAKDVIGSALEGAPIPVTSTTSGNVSPKETTPVKGTLGITSKVDDKTPQYQNPAIHTYEEPGLFKEVIKGQEYYALQAANTQEVFEVPLRETTALPGTLSPSYEISEDNPIYVNPSTFTTEDLVTGPPPEYAKHDLYYTKLAFKHQETYGEPLKDSTTNFTNPGRISEISGSDTAYVHPSIFTNKYLGFSEAGPVPDQSLFADGILPNYYSDISNKNQETRGEPLQDTTVPEGFVGRPKETNELDTVQKYIPHIVDEKFETIGTRYYDPKDTYLTFKKTVGTKNKNVLKENRVGLGDQGGRQDADKLQNNYWTVSSGKLEIDSVNALDISALNTRQDATKEARDLAKLFFEIITPDGSKHIHFRALIENIDDNYNANWEGHKYVGRAEEFYTYAGFSRDINITFNVVAATRSELKPIYKKMVYLASTTAPTYGSTGGFMRGTLARLTVGSYFDGIPGVITSVKYSLIDDLPWEIAMLEPEGLEKDVQEIPTGLKCSVSFKPIHDFAPQTALQHYFTSKVEGKSFFDEEVYTAVKQPKSTLPPATITAKPVTPTYSREQVLKDDKEKTMNETVKKQDATKVDVKKDFEIERELKVIKKEEANKKAKEEIKASGKTKEQQKADFNKKLNEASAKFTEDLNNAKDKKKGNPWKKKFK